MQKKLFGIHLEKWYQRELADNRKVYRKIYRELRKNATRKKRLSVERILRLMRLKEPWETFLAGTEDLLWKRYFFRSKYGRRWVKLVSSVKRENSRDNAAEKAAAERFRRNRKS